MPDPTGPNGDTIPPPDIDAAVLVHGVEIERLKEGQAEIRADLRLILERVTPQSNGPALIAAVKDVVLLAIGKSSEVAVTKTGFLLAAAILVAVTLGGSQVVSVGLEGLTIMPATMANKRAVAEHDDSQVLRDSEP